ncbi:MAG: ribosomal protein S18-alanine N-acetyltransferase [Eubacteriales bacterium]
MRSEPRTLRALTPQDAALVAAIEAACFAEPWQEPDIRACLCAAVNRGVLVQEEGVPCGFLLWQSIHPEWELLRTAVLPAYRHRGLGRTLLTHVQALVAQEGYTHGYLEVRAGNRAAQSLYRCCGFVELSRRPAYYRAPTEDALVMVYYS